jgi:hypothetical protein
MHHYFAVTGSKEIENADWSGMTSYVTISAFGWIIHVVHIEYEYFGVRTTTKTFFTWYQPHLKRVDCKIRKFILSLSQGNPMSDMPLPRSDKSVSSSLEVDISSSPNSRL